MPYKYTKSLIPITAESQYGLKDQYVELFQENLNDQFFNASDVWSVEEETANGSEEYAYFDVRITHVINAETGLKLGDDWKTVLFKDISHQLELGRRYLFDNSIWLTVNTEKIKNLAGSCTIRRCNNMLRWIDEATGAYYKEPCAIEYLVKEPRDYFTSGSPFSTPGGFLKLHCQFNEISNKIRENQRFLFGTPNHWTCYKVIGTGINDFRDDSTTDFGSPKILTLDLIANFVDTQLDDLVNGIANVNVSLYTISVTPTNIQGAPATTIQLFPVVTYNGNTTDRPLVWQSSDITVATVDTNGLVTLISEGNCTISVGIENNPLPSATSNIYCTLSPTPYGNILITPEENYVLEGTTQNYTVYLIENDVEKPDTFVITCNPNGVSPDNYVFSAYDNAFTITNNLRDDISYLTITCTSGLYTRDFVVFLRGAWLNSSTPPS